MSDYVLVPRVASEGMLSSGHAETPYCHAEPDECQAIIGDRTCYAAMGDAYAAMIAAAPSGGKVSREKLRKAVGAVYLAGLKSDSPDRAEDALAHALGLEVEPDE